MGAHEETARQVLRQLEDGRQLVPPHLWTGIVNHVLDGYPTGGFLGHLFANDLLNAVCGADETTLAGIRELMIFMHNHAPSRCRGSREEAQAWRVAGGIRGGAHLVEEAR